MPIYLLDDTLMVKIFYESKDCDFEDNICFSFYEDCPDEEKIFRAGQSNLYLTARQARQLARAFIAAAEASEKACPDRAE